MIGAFPDDPPTGQQMVLTDKQLASYSRSLIVKAALTTFVVGTIVDATLIYLWNTYWKKR